MTFDFLAELPAADVRIGKTQHLRIYGFADIEPRLVEMRANFCWCSGPLHLTCAQAEAIAAGLLNAVAKARGDG